MARLSAVEARTGFVSADTGRLHVRDIGQGPSILVLHGGPDFDYDYLLPELDVLAGWFRVIYYDQRGRGRSAGGVRPADVSVDSEMDDVDLVRRHFGLETMAVLGHSWGAVLAMEYVSRHPERLTHLIVMNTAPATNADVRVFREHLRHIRSAREIADMKSLAATAEFRAGDLDVESEYYRIHFRPAFHATALLDRLIPRLRTNFTPERVLTARAIEQRLYAQTWLSQGYDVLLRLSRLSAPTLVIHGEDDFVPVAVAAHVADAIPAGRLVVLRQCGHFAHLEAPGAVARHARDLVAS